LHDLRYSPQASPEASPYFPYKQANTDLRPLHVKREQRGAAHFATSYVILHHVQAEHSQGPSQGAGEDACHGPPAGSTKQLQKKSAAGAAAGCEQKGKERELRRTDTGRAGARTSILTEAQAVEVFKLRPAVRSERASLCAELAEKFGITTTAIRHIWDRRTWVWTNMPHWTEAEMAASLAEGVCECCRKNKISRIEDTCSDCPLNRKRGRPRGARDTYRRQRKANGSATPVHPGPPAGAAGSD
jgi:hypothetical protein